MIFLRHTKLLIISGLIWFAAGALLLSKGVNFLVDDIKGLSIFSENHPLLSMMTPYLGSLEQAALFVLALALIVGFFKGKFVLGKSAKQSILRIYNLPEPVSLAQIYSVKNYIILGAMFGIGMSMKFIGLPLDVRGFIDIAIGSALVKGSMFYFRGISEKAPKQV